MFMFGSIEKLEDYWQKSSPADYLAMHNALNSISQDPLFCGFLVPEVLLSCRYLKLRGRLMPSAKDSHIELFSNHLGVIDSSEINFEWLKLPYPIGNNIYTLSPLLARLSWRAAEMSHFYWLSKFFTGDPQIALSSEPI